MCGKGMRCQQTIHPLRIVAFESEGLGGKGGNVPVDVGGGLSVEVVRQVRTQMIQYGFAFRRKIGIKEDKL